MVLPAQPLHFHLPAFDGPLDLLLHLIRKNQIDICDIPIAEITRQYLEYLDLWQSMDLAIAGEYLVMAATLVEIKSRMLLPQAPAAADSSDEDPRAELVQRLIAYERLQATVETLREWEQRRSLIFVRGAVENPEDYSLPQVQAADAGVLAEALRRVLARAGLDEEPVTAIMPRRTANLRIKMAEILRRVRAADAGLLFDDLVDDPWNRVELGVTFLALLELVRLARVRALQMHPEAPILLVKVEEGT